MADNSCVFLESRSIYKYCTSKKHPKHNKKTKEASFGVTAPDVCFKGGKGCPIFKKENK